MPALHYLSLLYFAYLAVTHVRTLKVPNVQLLLLSSKSMKHTNSGTPTPFVAYDRLA